MDEEKKINIILYEGKRLKRENLPPKTDVNVCTDCIFDMDGDHYDERGRCVLRWDGKYFEDNVYCEKCPIFKEFCGPAQGWNIDNTPHQNMLFVNVYFGYKYYDENTLMESLNENN